MKQVSTQRQRWRKSVAPALAALVTCAVVALPVSNAIAVPSDVSEAQAQVIRSTIFGNNDLAGVGFSNSGFPSTGIADTGNIDVGILSDETIELGGLPIPLISDGTGPGLIDLGALGVLSSYSHGSSNTHALASAGAIGADGSISIDGTEGVGIDPAVVDLTLLFDQLGIQDLTDTVIDAAQLQVGLLAAKAESNNGTVASEYVIAGAELDLSSPLVGDLTTGLGQRFKLPRMV